MRTGTMFLALACVFICVSVPAQPPGFIEETIVSGLDFPVSMAFAPDGRIFFLELNEGRVRVIENGTLLPTVFGEVSVDTGGDRGILGIAFHPDYVNNGYVYISFSVLNQSTHEIGRFTDVNNVGTNYTPILTDLPSQNIHSAGNIAFGPDGMLYHTVGDLGTPANSQDPDVYAGKIHRYNDDGTIPADNPYTSGVLSRYCMGLRNSFDLAWNYDLNILYASENATSDGDAVNIIQPGLNYGWPDEICDPAPGIEPVLACFASIGPTGVTPYTGSNFGPEYLNDVFFGSWVEGNIYRIDLDVDGTTYIGQEVFHQDACSFFCMVDVVDGPDGYLYYATSSAIKRLRRMVPDAPTNLSCTPAAGDVTLTWTNNGSAGGDYEEVRVIVNGGLLASLQGDATQYVHVSPSSGTNSYEVRGVESGVESDPATCEVVIAGDSFVRGDCNADQALNIVDAIFELLVLFQSGGPAPCDDACDVNDDGTLDISDPTYGLTHLFDVGAPPPTPFPACGADPTTGDGLGCATYSCP